MSEQKEQVLFFSDDELQLFKDIFAENTGLLKALRSIFFKQELSEWQQNLISVIVKDKDVVALLRKTFLPEITLDVPIGQTMDLWKSLDINNKSINEAVAHIEARKLAIPYIDARLKELEGSTDADSGVKDLDEMMEEDAYIGLLARNSVISHIDGWLNQIRVMAGEKSETVEETFERLHQNSNK